MPNFMDDITEYFINEESLLVTLQPVIQQFYKDYSEYDDGVEVPLSVVIKGIAGALAHEADQALEKEEEQRGPNPAENKLVMQVTQEEAVTDVIERLWRFLSGRENDAELVIGISIDNHIDEWAAGVANSAMSLPLFSTRNMPTIWKLNAPWENGGSTTIRELVSNRMDHNIERHGKPVQWASVPPAFVSATAGAGALEHKTNYRKKLVAQRESLIDLQESADSDEMFQILLGAVTAIDHALYCTDKEICDLAG